MQQVASKITSFTDLTAWQKGHELVLGIYSVAQRFPVAEQYGLTSQIKRASVSITSNIAEGFSRRTKADKINYYHIALGSTTEVQNQLLIARDLKFVDKALFKQLADLSVEVSKVLNGLIKSLKVVK
ncbi:four helix bundle protein [Candidatus Saccharibacteria bacterium]|jgi:four helix bundle protein|nr:MAG: four helix bundle protein [Candidatus Saccharibacteria bacterium]